MSDEKPSKDNPDTAGKLTNPLHAMTHKRYPKERTWCHGRDFWRWNPSREEWINLPRPEMRTALLEEGFSPFVEDGEKSCALDREFLRISIDNQVAYAGPLAGYDMGLHEFEGQRALVTRDMDLLPVERGDWSTLRAVFDGAYGGIFSEEDLIDQRPWFYGWCRHAVKCLYQGPHAPGNALFLAGHRGAGKTLTGDILVHMLGKRVALPYEYMRGRDNFNKDLFEAVVQLIDDKAASSSYQDRANFAASIKEMVAASRARMRGMHRDGQALHPLWRLIVMVNMEPDRLMVIPPLDADVEDKMLILQAYKCPMPMPAESPEERHAFWQQLEAEMPAFLWWLLNEFELPSQLKDRFGVRHWCHPDVEVELREVSPEQQLHEFIERYFRKHGRTEWVGSVSDLRRDLENHAGLSIQETKDLPKPAYMGTKLQKLKSEWPEHYEFARTRQGRQWTIRKTTPEFTNDREGDYVEV